MTLKSRPTGAVADTATRAALAAVPRLAGALVDVANADVSQVGVVWRIELRLECKGHAWGGWCEGL